ncbi:hypothetical protein TEA_026038 [Camellia sinensis var. sinensis]|uniref:protein-serine/threonine phosphatase n=1 Tax=Camellia sinensis var. sinensis TaxID=542762 RepID=A0A4S4DER3_CAMSN|nr:hypothetical protein TEA_026038 [Camellia sinensis var. sinensis]
MVCNSSFRFVILQAGHIERFTWGRVQLSNLGRSLNATWAQTYSKGHKFTKRGEMMVDSGATAKGGPTVDILREKDDDRSYASGGWKRCEDRRLSCGYSSFRGKRASMEDFFDVKTSKINGQTVCMFGIFDGHGGSRAAEFLKEHLFENLMKHPQFLTNTKLAISETYQQTDMDFLESEKDTFRDDGSTASAAVLVGNHLYVANVGDSRTVISKAGKGAGSVSDSPLLSRTRLFTNGGKRNERRARTNLVTVRKGKTWVADFNPSGHWTREDIGRRL